jgi:hypothetical protein
MILSCILLLIQFLFGGIKRIVEYFVFWPPNTPRKYLTKIKILNANFNSDYKTCYNTRTGSTLSRQITINSCSNNKAKTDNTESKNLKEKLEIKTNDKENINTNADKDKDVKDIKESARENRETKASTKLQGIKRTDEEKSIKTYKTVKTDKTEHLIKKNIQDSLCGLLNEDVILQKNGKSYRTYEILSTIKVTFSRIFYDSDDRLEGLRKIFSLEVDLELTDHKKLGGFTENEALLNQAKAHMKNEKIKQVPVLVYKPMFR